jgi:hypothetical protein
MGAGLITGYALGVMGYPTPLPYGTNPQLAAYMFLDSYEKEAKVCGSFCNLHHFFALTAFGTDRIFFPAFAVPFYGHNQT